jgi:hypothetical protein
MEPVQNPDEFMKPAKAFTNLSQQYFINEDADILKMLISEFSFESVEDFFESIFEMIGERIDFENLEVGDLEQIDFIALAKDIANSMKRKGQMTLKEEEAKKFDETFKKFGKASLHDLLFPMILVENPNIAVSVKNILKRNIASSQPDEDIDLSKIYEDLEIESLPTEFSMDLLNRLGGKIPGLENIEVVETNEVESEEPTLLYCELSTEQAIYLASMLKDDRVINNWEQLFHLFKINNKKYDSVLVNPNKVGLLLSIIHLLYERKTLAKVRYLRTNKGNGIWPFFEGYLINSRTCKQFTRELRKLKSENNKDEEAQKIIDYLFDIKNQAKIAKRAKEITEE